METCKIKKCKDEPGQSGWCLTHYLQWKQCGDPELPQNYKMHRPKTYGELSTEERIHKYTKKIERKEFQNGLKFHRVKDLQCWEWQRSISITNGYPYMNVGNKVYLVYRVAYEKLVGKIPKGLQILHKCDNKPCCNPNHLFLGTQKDNMVDMVNKCRKPPRCLFNREEILQIIKLHYVHNFTQKQIAEDCNVSMSTISRIIRGETYTHLNL